MWWSRCEMVIDGLMVVEEEKWFNLGRTSREGS